MSTTFDALGVFKRSPLGKYKRWIGHIAYEICITLELSKYVFRFIVIRIVLYLL
jgi:hypothetical protein